MGGGDNLTKVPPEGERVRSPPWGSPNSSIICATWRRPKVNG